MTCTKNCHSPLEGTSEHKAVDKLYRCWCSVSMAWNNVMSRLAAAADMCREGCLTLELQSRARANVPTDRATTRNWSIWRSDRPCSGVHISDSSSTRSRLSLSTTSPFSLTNDIIDRNICKITLLKCRKYYDPYVLYLHSQKKINRDNSSKS